MGKPILDLHRHTRKVEIEEPMKKVVTSILRGFVARLLLSATAASLLLVVAVAAGQTPLLDPGNDRGLFVVEDVVSQFWALKHHGEALGWVNPEWLGAPDPSDTNHYQGLARYPGEGAPVFYVTQKDPDGGYLHVVQFGTRPTTGERLRSNLQAIGTDTEDTYPPYDPICPPWVDTCPPWEDSLVLSIRFDGSLVIDDNDTPDDPSDDVVLPAYVHPGSMAIVDDILFVPLDTPVDSPEPGQIVLFDLRDDPIDPKPIKAIPLDHQIDNLAVTELDDGRYLVWVNGDGGNLTKFYRTTGTDLRDKNLGRDEGVYWDPDSPEDFFGPGNCWSCIDPPNCTTITNICFPRGTCAHQSSTFLRSSTFLGRPDGSLYMISMRHGDPCYSPTVGPDYAYLYQVDSKPSGGFKLTYLWRLHLYCAYDGGGGPEHMRICNFAAANNAFVSPSGELILYSIPHADEDDFVFDIVRLAEFRHRDVNRAGSPLRLPSADAGGPYTVSDGGTVGLSGSGAAPADRPWVELYDDDNFWDRSIVVDYDDRNLLELDNFNNLDGFNDKTTSVRWRAPVGLDIELYDDDNYGDRYIRLKGTGRTEEITDLDSQVVVSGLVEHYNPYKNVGEKLEFNDKTSSLQFVGTLPSTSVILEWDLDGDGLFGETGTGAARGDEVGATPTFSAAGLNGPTQVTVTLRVTASSGVSVTDTAVIDVTNGAPDAIIYSSGGDGGLCFIATAAYGSRMAEKVRVFQKVRDEYLLTHELGRAFVSGYYKYSPPLAHWIAKHPAMRRMVRIGLYPVLEVSKWLVGEKPSE